MTAPERIWAWHLHRDLINNSWLGACSDTAHRMGGTEYIRADLVADQIRAAFIAGFASSGADVADRAEAYAAILRHR